MNAIGPNFLNNIRQMITGVVGAANGVTTSSLTPPQPRSLGSLGRSDSFVGRVLAQPQNTTHPLTNASLPTMQKYLEAAASPRGTTQTA